MKAGWSRLPNKDRSGVDRRILNRCPCISKQPTCLDFQGQSVAEMGHIVLSKSERQILGQVLSEHQCKYAAVAPEKKPTRCVASEGYRPKRVEQERGGGGWVGVRQNRSTKERSISKNGVGTRGVAAGDREECDQSNCSNPARFGGSSPHPEDSDEGSARHSNDRYDARATNTPAERTAKHLALFPPNES